MGKSLQPSLGALLTHDSVRSPCRQRVVESLVPGAHRLLSFEGHAGVVKARQIAHPVIAGGGHHPGVAAVTQHVRESAVVLKQENRFVGQCRLHGVPINGVRIIDAEIRDDWLPLQSQIRRRREISLLEVLQVADECLLRCTAGAGIPFDSALIDHDREGEAGMFFGFGHHQLRSLVDAVSRTIPVDDHAIDAAADHICDLIVNLGSVDGVVADIHVVRAAEPQHEVGVDFCIRAGIEQGVHVYLADVSGAGVPVALAGEIVSCARIVSGQGSQRGCRYDRVACGAHTGRR